MKNTLFVTIGISGSGKSIFAKTLSKYVDFVLVCPDNIRKRITGNISDQSQNDRVYSTSIVSATVALTQGKNVFYSATSLTKSSRKVFFDLQASTKCNLIFFMMYDSYDPKLCHKRVEKDLAKHVDRSNTLVVITDTGKDVIDTQYEKFKNICIANDIEGKSNCWAFTITDSKDKSQGKFIKKFISDNGEDKKCNQ